MKEAIKTELTEMPYDELSVNQWIRDIVRDRADQPQFGRDLVVVHLAGCWPANMGSS